VPKRTYPPCLTDHDIPRVDESPPADWVVKRNLVLDLMLRVDKGREERDQLMDTIRLLEDTLQSTEADLQSTKAKLLTAETKLDAVRNILWM
jgi:hypothetical protein